MPTRGSSIASSTAGRVSTTSTCAATKSRATSTRRWNSPSAIRPTASAWPSMPLTGSRGSVSPVPACARPSSTSRSPVKSRPTSTAWIVPRSRTGSGHFSSRLTVRARPQGTEKRTKRMKAQKQQGSVAATSAGHDRATLLQRYGCGPVQLTGNADALYERHLLFDNVMEVTTVGARERFEAIARSVRDVLSQRWLRTEETYQRENAKRIYYLSMEFLIGRSLANNVTNLLLDPIVSEGVKKENLDWHELLDQEPDAGLGNGGLGRLAACFLDSMATMSVPAMGYGLRYEYGIFKQSIQDGWQQESPDNWLRRPDPWEVARPNETVEVKLNCSFEVSAGTLRAVAGKPSALIGVPYDRPVVGYGGKTINTMRLWAATAHDYFNFQEFSSGDFVGALAETLEAESLTRVLYPDDSTSLGQGL